MGIGVVFQIKRYEIFLPWGGNNGPPAAGRYAAASSVTIIVPCIVAQWPGKVQT